jgi:predicted hotdog family 3-hydroxylacyl-ACP dehydratase
MTACPYPIADLLPHAEPMVLLDRVTAWDDEGLTASVTVRPDTRFATPNRGVAAHIGVEWMAQACGAFAGLRAKATGLPVLVGFLLGTRDFTADRAWFETGETLAVSVRQVFDEAGMAVFDCHIDSKELTCARARLTVFQPSGSENGEATA